MTEKNTIKPDLQAGAATIARYAAMLPPAPGVYRMVDAGGRVLYVGKARNLAKRVASYTQLARLSNRIKRMVAFTASMEFVTTHTEAEALLLEANLIKEYSPPYNILLKDDKSFPYILLAEGHDFPQIVKHRGERVRKGMYFGPFASAGDVNETLSYLQKVFLLRPCSDSIFSQRTRPCLEYQIKRCSAPCVNKISKEAYAERVQEAQAFLSGKSRAVQEKLAKQMHEASEAMDYEKAAEYRDRIRALTQIQAKQSISVGQMDADIIGLYQEDGGCCVQVFFFRGGQHFGNRAYFPVQGEESGAAEILSAFLGQFYQRMPAPREIVISHAISHVSAIEQALSSLYHYPVHITHPKRGEKLKVVTMAVQNAKEALERKKAEYASKRERLEAVAALFDLESVPKRIEVYDNSHIMGTNEVGVMIAAGAEGFIRHAYRKFTIQKTGTENIQHGDDYAMMREVFTRRFTRLKKEDPEQQSGEWPDLVLIDGGLGQLRAVESVFAELGISNVAYVAIAKGPDRNAGREQFFLPGKSPFTLPKNDPVLYYLQTLRDEAHRFAIGAHRQKRQKALTSSPLDNVPGIGGKRKKALLTHFGSAKAVAQAGVEDLMQVEGISKAIAQKIYEYLHSS